MYFLLLRLEKISFCVFQRHKYCSKHGIIPGANRELTVYAEVATSNVTRVTSLEGCNMTTISIRVLR